jgi:uncharacterized protein (DUF983 family)
MAKKTEEEQDDPREGQMASLPGEFKCPNCGEMILHGSKVGVEVACSHCGERYPVPEPK